MNLLVDKWIPVINKKTAEESLVCLEDILCGKEGYELVFIRDDLKFALLGLLICLTQSLGLKQIKNSSLTKKEFRSSQKNIANWFDLNHAKTPFMQYKNLNVKEVTPIQKLFAGLPAGNNHLLFNNVGEIEKVCSSCAAIALFNQSVNCPQFGGGFKSGIRGAAPITTFIGGNNLRETILLNVIGRKFLKGFGVTNNFKDSPTWIKKIKPGSNINVQEIGLIRGLFWTPTPMELVGTNPKEENCDCCGNKSKNLYSHFKKKKFKYNLNGFWKHPHSPSEIIIDDKTKKEKIINLSFNKKGPIWIQLSGFVIERTLNNSGKEPAAVIRNCRNIFLGRKFQLLVGGYQNKQSSIVGRCHEVLSLSGDWNKNKNDQKLELFLESALEIKNSLCRSVYFFGKVLDLKGLKEKAEHLFFSNTEFIIYSNLYSMDVSLFDETYERIVKLLCEEAMNIFDEITQPYRNSQKGFKNFVIQRKILNRLLSKFIK